MNMQSEASLPVIHWSPAKKAAFRFLFLYLVFYCFPFPLDATDLTNPITKPYYNFLDILVKTIGSNLLDVPVRVAFPGFDKVDDSYYGLSFLFIDLSLSLIGVVVWSLLDSRRNNYLRLSAWFTLYLRYFLASYLLGYGFVKFFPSQFEEITASRMIMEVGEQTPMLLAWNFMGYSVAFNMVSGSIEILAGLLLFFRRTTTLGALLATITFSFVALLDFCFNVPVKLLVVHLLLISLVLLLTDAKRLAAVFLLNKPAEPLVYPQLLNSANWQKALLMIQALVAVGILYKAVNDSLTAAKQWGRYAPRVPLYGLYHADVFIRNKDTVAPLQTDSLRWQQLVIDGGSWKQSGVIKFSNERKLFYNVMADTSRHTLRLQSITDTLITYNLRFAQPEKSQLVLEGAWNKDSIKVILTRQNLDSTPLLSDRFRIVSE